ncbi:MULTISPECIES: hypothetical protein [unclassified Spirosoma]|uniref:hypothetical protein n=1 Tax=unclassified Spirosoma TaxID=2621999 RepID=UPI00095904BC|nr:MULTISPECIES: hypothetical protein [unclassified Spirosoma]MBN8823213.1 hypothetical protein [Spirosoma sp.]OJW72637.1 MAG: hypothetical protein BGO59_16095 [Spirosoma sp. 48-14]
MSLSNKQITALRHDLIGLASITYDDLLAELVDHYATLTEQKMAAGQSFDEASKWAWFELGGGIGLDHIQKDYEKSIVRQVRIQHRAILKSYFRWPTILSTTLLCLLLFILVPLLPPNTVATSIFYLALSPLVLLVWGYFKSVDQRISTGKLVWQYFQNQGMIPINLLQISLNLTNAFSEKSSHTIRNFLQTYPIVSVLICLLTLLYSLSFVQLFYKKFYYKLA